MPTAHPHIPAFASLTRPAQSAASSGYHMPAEWSAQACVWVVPPHNRETWPGCFDQACDQFERFITALSDAVPVSTTDELAIPTNDSWIRDFGPIFVITHADHLPHLACHDFRFNTWGDKYETRDLDDTVPQHLAQHLRLPLWIHDFVLEGGSIDVNGKGSALTTTQCLLNPNRNPQLTKADIQAALADTLAITNLIWLPGGIIGDDTDGHVDDIARFVAPDRVVAVTAPPSHPDHHILSRNLAALKQARDQDGAALDIIELPAPSPIIYDYPPDRCSPGGRAPVPASYANFLIANGSIFLPAFHQPADDIAARLLENAMPGYRVVPLPADKLVVGLGGFHCLSQQQPRAE